MQSSLKYVVHGFTGDGKFLPASFCTLEDAKREAARLWDKHASATECTSVSIDAVMSHRVYDRGGYLSEADR